MADDVILIWKSKEYADTVQDLPHGEENISFLKSLEPFKHFAAEFCDKLEGMSSGLLSNITDKKVINDLKLIC